MSAALAIEGLSLSFGDGADALSDVTLAVEPGEVLAVVGPSGAGKSSLLRLVCGLLRPTGGRVVIGGRDMAAVPPERRPVAMVFQGFALFPHLTVAANIAFGMKVRREPDAPARLEEAAAALGLSGLLDRLPHQLSGGEQQRVALARALVRRPVVFCLDEPLSSLDPVTGAEARRLLRATVRREGRCAVMVTHDQADAMTMGDRVAVLHQGRLEQIGPPQEVYERPASIFVASFIGEPPMSLLRPPVFGLSPGDCAVVGVRAEHVALRPGSGASVVAVEHRGHERHVVLDLAGQPVVARVPPETDAAFGALEVGRPVAVEVDPRHLHRFDADGRR